jgi:hypothetical protein
LEGNIMIGDGIRYTFASEVVLEDVEASLLLATFAVEALHGETQVCLDAAHDFDPERRVLTIDATTGIGRDLTRIFTNFLRREYGLGGFRTERVSHAGSGLTGAAR